MSFVADCHWAMRSTNGVVLSSYLSVVLDRIAPFCQCPKAGKDFVKQLRLSALSNVSVDLVDSALCTKERR